MIQGREERYSEVSGKTSACRGRDIMMYRSTLYDVSFSTSWCDLQHIMMCFPTAQQVLSNSTASSTRLNGLAGIKRGIRACNHFAEDLESSASINQILDEDKCKPRHRAEGSSMIITAWFSYWSMPPKRSVTFSNLVVVDMGIYYLYYVFERIYWGILILHYCTPLPRGSYRYPANQKTTTYANNRG